MMLFGMDNKETAEYVKKWFEERFLRSIKKYKNY